MTITPKAAILASIWGKTLTELEVQRVAAETLDRAMPAGSYICRKGEPADHWIGVIEGLVKLSSVSESGKLTTFAGIPPGAWFGEGSLLKSENRRYDVIALRDCRVALMPRATFNWLLDTSIAFNRFLLSQLNERLGYFIAMVEYDRLLGPDARVARCLASMYSPYLYPATSAALQLSQEEIGYLSGVSRQRVNQALRELEKAGLLRVDYGGIQVLDLQGLRDFTG